MSVPELLIASAIVAAVGSGLAAVTTHAQRSFIVEQEVADLTQRLRAAVDALTTDFRNARMIWPYRVGAVGHDPAAGVFFRANTVSVLLSSANGTNTTRTYYLTQAPGTPQLSRYDGGGGDFPIVPDVVDLSFEYFGDDIIPAGMLTDGPWYPDDVSVDRFDVDLLQIRRVRVRVRLQAPIAFRGTASPLFLRGGTASSISRAVPDRQAKFDVTLRNFDARR